MGKILEKIVAGMLSLGVGACAHPQIGIDCRQSQNGAPVREWEVFSPGDCFILAGDECAATTKVSMCVRYTDVNNNGSFDKGTDKLVYRVPRSDPPIFYCQGSENPQLVRLE